MNATIDTNDLKQAAEEIRGLRTSSNLMRARLNMFDDLMLLFKSSPNRENQGATIDIAWVLEEVARKAEKGPQGTTDPYKKDLKDM